MPWQKPSLTDEEKQVHDQLLKLAGGMGCLTERTGLTQYQTEVMLRLSKKQYVTVTKRKFMVVLPV
jgi:hypothetical protein